MRNDSSTNFLGKDSPLGSQMVASLGVPALPAAFSIIQATKKTRPECPSHTPGPLVTSQLPLGNWRKEAVPWSCMPGMLPCPEEPGPSPHGPPGLQCAGECARRWWPGWDWRYFLAEASPCLRDRCEPRSKAGSGHPGTQRENKEQGILRFLNPVTLQRRRVRPGKGK